MLGTLNKRLGALPSVQRRSFRDNIHYSSLLS